jgi:hypothetical protein
VLFLERTFAFSVYFCRKKPSSLGEREWRSCVFRRKRKCTGFVCVWGLQTYLFFFSAEEESAPCSTVFQARKERKSVCVCERKLKREQSNQPCANTALCYLLTSWCYCFCFCCSNTVVASVVLSVFERFRKKLKRSSLYQKEERFRRDRVTLCCS